MKRALVTGISGQDGHYLGRLLLDHGYEVHGTARPGGRTVSTDGLAEEQRERLVVHPLDLADPGSPDDVVARTGPDEIYHLAGQTEVGHSLEDPEYTAQVNAIATMRLLEAVRRHAPTARVFHAASSELFGDVRTAPQDERTPMQPRNPYGVAKLFAYGMVRVYRRQHGLFACNGILYNHESPRRGRGFITQKIAEAAAARRPLTLRSLEARRDWGFAGDFVEAFHAMLQADSPDDYVVATGNTHSVRDFARIAYERVGLDYREHVEECAPEEPGVELRGDARHAEQRLGWRARLPFEDLVHLMVDAAQERAGLDP